MKLFPFLFVIAVALYQTSAEPSKCRDGATQCEGCQCCPDGYLCPGGSGCPFKCPKDSQESDKPGPDKAGFCRDGATRCDSCQCCPDGKSCPGSTGCPGKCPKDDGGDQPTPVKPSEPGFCRDGATRCEGCQCCPDGKSCPGSSGCPSKCPKDDGSDPPTPVDPVKPSEPGFCRDGATRCEGCQCCPDEKSCPGASGCPSKCPKDDGSDKPVDPDKPDPGSGDHRLGFQNLCPFDIWVGALNAPGKMLPQRGGWLMKKAGKPYNLTLPREWSGRFWGRTDCAKQTNGQFACITGDCGHQMECNGAGGEPPATLAEFTFDGSGKLDYFDVSLVDGYNLPMQINPVSGSYVPGSGICEKCGCNKDLNLFCLPELRQVVKSKTVGCKSACAAFNTDQYCCHGEYDCSPHSEKCEGGKKRCDPAKWPVNYSQLFKMACPTSYSYAYDDPSSTFTCLGKPNAHYDITFCPSS